MTLPASFLEDDISEEAQGAGWSSAVIVQATISLPDLFILQPVSTKNIENAGS